MPFLKGKGVVETRGELNNFLSVDIHTSGIFELSREIILALPLNTSNVF